MSLVVPCPGCPTKLSAPESAAGKQIRCPKCKAVVTVPALIAAEEVPVVEAKVTPSPQPKPAPKRADDDDDDDEKPRKKAPRRDEEEDEDESPRKKKKRPVYDDDDDDEKPRKKKRKATKGGGGGAVVALVVVGGLLLLGGGAYGIYALFGKGGMFAKKAPVPAGWKEYSYPQDGFKAYFPKPPASLINNHNPMRFGGAPGGLFGANEAQDIESLSVYTCGDGIFGEQTGGVTVTVTVARFHNGVPRSVRDNVNQVTNSKLGNMQSRRIRWLGYDAGEFVMGNTVMRIVYTDKAQITAQLVGSKGQRATPEEENGFFDNFELIK